MNKLHMKIEKLFLSEYSLTRKYKIYEYILHIIIIKQIKL